MTLSLRRAVMLTFGVLGLWVLGLELQVIAIPGLQLGPVFGDYAHNVIELLAGFLCLAGAWQARREQTAWLLIGIGVLAWALGNLYYTVVLYELEAPPIPSPADVGFLLFPVLTGAGVFALVRARTRNLPITLWIDGAIAALAVTAVSAAIVFETAFDNLSGKPVEVATMLAYPVTDLILIGVAVGALSATGWRLDRTWVLLAAGIGTFWLADSLYLVESLLGTLSPPSWYDIGWTLGLLLVAFASWHPAAAQRSAEPDGVRFIAAPLGFGAVGLAMLIYGSLADLNPLAVALSALALVAVMARLMLTFRENVSILQTSRGEALTDALTGLGNRRALARELAAAPARRRRRPPARPRALRPRRLQALQRHLRSPRGRRPARPARRQPLDVSVGPRRCVPDGRRRVLRPLPPGRRGRRSDHRRRGQCIDRPWRGLHRHLLLRRDRAPARGGGRDRGAADRRPAHVRAEERGAHVRHAPEQSRAGAGAERAQPGALRPARAASPSSQS